MVFQMDWRPIMECPEKVTLQADNIEAKFVSKGNGYTPRPPPAAYLCGLPCPPNPQPNENVKVKLSFFTSSLRHAPLLTDSVRGHHRCALLLPRTCPPEHRLRCSPPCAAAAAAAFSVVHACVHGGVEETGVNWIWPSLKCSLGGEGMRDEAGCAALPHCRTVNSPAFLA